MAVVSMAIFRRVWAERGRPMAMVVATMPPGACRRLADQLERERLQARVRYDAQARRLRDYGLEPAEVLGLRP